MRHLGWLLVAACGGGGGSAATDGAGSGSGTAFSFTASGTRDATPFSITKPCAARLDNNDVEVEAYDASLALGFQVRWTRNATAMTYPNDNNDPEVTVFVIHIVDGNDINEGSQQGTVTFDRLGESSGAEVAGHFDNIVLDRTDLQITASGTFLCRLN